MRFMKHKKIMSAVMVASMLISYASSLIHPVSANTDLDIEISTEATTSDDIVIESSGDDIVISNESEVESNDDILISEAEDNHVADDTTVSDNYIISDDEDTAVDSDVVVTEDEESVDSEDTAVTSDGSLVASVSKNNEKNTLNIGTESVLSVQAENKSDKTAIFKVYFTNVDGELSDDKSTWNEYLTQPALNMQVKDLSDDYTLSVDIVDNDGNISESSLAFLKEVKDDEIISRYAKLALPAGTKTAFDMTIWSDKNSTVTVIPVMEQDEAVYGDDASVTWEKQLTFFEKFVNFFTSKKEEADTASDDIQISDVQGVEVDVKGLEDIDFTSMRLVVLTEDASVITDTDNIIGAYGNIYLLQFDSVQETKEAYVRYKDEVTAVEPDESIAAATSTVSEDDVDVTDETVDVTDTADVVTEEITDSEETTVTDGIETEQNPIALLNDAEISTDVQNEHGVIALIDTGVTEHANVMDRVSVIDDVLEGNGHGDAMLQAIVSQDPNAKILSIRALDDKGFGTISSLVAAMEYAIEQDVDYINLSLYARATLTTSVLKQEIAKAIDAGIVVIGAAGNDGVDVADYVPGSVEEAYIIGSATSDGFKQVLSNYGDTVDYNVVADSTSEATALFTGYVSAHGLESVAGALNQGMIYETDFAGDDIVVNTTQDVDFSEYEVDTTKSFVVRYTFADKSKLNEDDTLASLYHSDRYMGALYDTLVSQADVYAVGDGTYKVKANAPILNGYATSDYVDAIFARGNDYGQVVSDGVSFDLHTGIATIEESAFEGASEDDFSDLQLQVLIPVSGIPERIIHDITVVNNDGSEYIVRVPVYGLQIESIPLAIEGIDEDIDHTYFEVYVDGRTTPVSDLYWDNDTHTLYLSGYYAASIHSVKIVVKKDVDSVFQTAYNFAGVFEATQEYRNISCMFYLQDGTDVSGLTIGTYIDKALSRVGISGRPHMPEASSIIGTVSAYGPVSSGKLDFDDKSVSQIGIPNNLFSEKGVDSFQFYKADGTVMDCWEKGYNAAISVYCHHIGDSLIDSRNAIINVYYQILDRWTGGDGTTYFVMVMMTDEGVATAGNDAIQSSGGVIRFGVRAPQKGGLSIQKQSANTNITSGNSNYSLENAVYTVYSDSACTKKVTTIKTNSSGYAATSDDALDAGTYYVKETTASKGYQLDNTKYTITVAAGSTASTNKKTSSEPPITSGISIIKQSTNPSMTNGNNCYSLAGAEYTIYTDANCTKSTGKKITTGADGKGSISGLALGNYWVKETKAPKGFGLDTGKHKASCTTSTSVSITSEEKPYNDPAGIEINKIWNGPQTSTVPSLAGTQFTIKYYDTLENYSANQLSTMTPKRTWVIEVKYNANTKKYLALFTDTYKVGGDAFYYTSAGYPTLPLGTITIQETKAAPGYTLDGEFKDENGNTFSPKDVYVTKILNQNGVVAVQGGNEYSAEDDPKPCNIKIVKSKADGTPLQGVQFTIKDSSGNTVTDMNGNAVGVGTTNASGVVEFKNLYPDVYTITETKTVSGQQLLKESITVYAPMRMTKEHAIANNLDTTKAYWDSLENCYLIFDQTFNVTNSVNFEMPMSGGTFDSKMLIPLGAGMVLLAGVFIIMFRKKKRLV